MALLGFGDLKDTALHALWDQESILKVQLAEGVSIEQLTNEIRTALVGVNSSLLSMPHYSGLFAVQDDVEVEYPIGLSNGFREATEYSVPDPQRGKTTGHSLPIKPWDRSLGWTRPYLRKARSNRLVADVKSAIADAGKLWQQQLLTQLFRKLGVTVGSTSLASSPFADGGTANSAWVPMDSPGGETFAYTHEHYLGYSTSGITNSTFNLGAVNVAVKHLQEHGHTSPYDMVISRTDLGSWNAIDNWKPPNWQGITYHSSAVERATFGDVEEYFGAIETDLGIVRVWETPRLPTYNFGVYKVYGAGDPRSPLRVRIDPIVGFGFNLVDGNYQNAPLELLLIYSEFGVGVGEDRTAAVLVDLEASSWTVPTIS